MNYSAMIQNRKSVHAFREKEVPSEANRGRGHGYQ